MKKTKKIKEDRATREEDPKFINPFFKKAQDAKKDQFKDKYDKRAQIFWEEVEGIKNLLNAANKGFQITDHRDQTITQYILWRMLNELKLFREDLKLQKVSEEALKERLGL